MTNPYKFLFGAAESRWWYGTDERARKVADRWIRLFWKRYVARLAEKHPGSIAHAEAAGWYQKPRVAIYRYAMDAAGIIKCEAPVKIEDREI
jgi:hypothetical protein